MGSPTSSPQPTTILRYLVLCAFLHAFSPTAADKSGGGDWFGGVGGLGERCLSLDTVVRVEIQTVFVHEYGGKGAFREGVGLTLRDRVHLIDLQVVCGFSTDGTAKDSSRVSLARLPLHVLSLHRYQYKYAGLLNRTLRRTKTERQPAGYQRAFYSYQTRTWRSRSWSTPPM
jgi:hypothetical protein